MFSKIREIKKKIKLFKAIGVIIGILFLLLLINSVYQSVKIYQLETQIEELQR